MQGERDAFVAYASASDRLVGAIIRAGERENRAYQEALSQAIEEALAEGETSKGTIMAEEACEWIREISDRAIARVNPNKNKRSAMPQLNTGVVKG